MVDVIRVAASESVRATASKSVPRLGQQLRRTHLIVFEVTHDVSLSSDSHKTVDVLANGYEHFARHVTTFLSPRRLILNVNSRSSFFDEQLRKFHYGGEAAMAGVCVGNYRSKKIGACHTSTTGLRDG